ncbi:MAG: hypothetical protein Q9221_008313 [Calogaya cf. arnoldii]
MRTSIFTLVLASLDRCYAAPPQNDFRQGQLSPQNDIRQGQLNLWSFAGKLPPATSIGENSTEFTLPIYRLPNIRFHTSWGYYDMPRNPMFVAADLVVAIHGIWRSTENEPVVNTVIERLKPYQSWECRITPRFFPRQPQLLTPQKIGFAFFTTFWGMTKLDRWPGHITTRIIESNPRPSPYTDQIGTVDINNIPIAQDTVSANNLTALEDVQWSKRWLNCFQNLQLLGLPKNPHDLVTADAQFSPKPEVHKYSFPCSNPGVADRLDFFIYPSGNLGGTSQLYWGDVLIRLQDWILKVAQGTDGGSSMQIPKGGKLVAEVSIFIQQKPPGNEQAEIATS